MRNLDWLQWSANDGFLAQAVGRRLCLLFVCIMVRKGCSVMELPADGWVKVLGSSPSSEQWLLAKKSPVQCVPTQTPSTPRQSPRWNDSTRLWMSWTVSDNQRSMPSRELPTLKLLVPSCRTRTVTRLVGEVGSTGSASRRSCCCRRGPCVDVATNGESQELRRSRASKAIPWCGDGPPDVSAIPPSSGLLWMMRSRRCQAKYGLRWVRPITQVRWTRNWIRFCGESPQQDPWCGTRRLSLMSSGVQVAPPFREEQEGLPALG